MHLVAHYDRDFRRLFEPDIVMEDGRRFPERPPVEEWFECGRRSLNLWQQYYANMNERWEMQVTHHWASAVALAAAEACRVTAGQVGSNRSDTMQQCGTLVPASYHFDCVTVTNKQVVTLLLLDEWLHNTAIIACQHTHKAVSRSWQPGSFQALCAGNNCAV